MVKIAFKKIKNYLFGFNTCEYNNIQQYNPNLLLQKFEKNTKQCL